MSCANNGVVTASNSQVFGQPVPSRLKSVVLRAGTVPTVRWTMTDSCGCPLDLTDCAVGDPLTVQVVLRIVENTLLGFDPDFPGVCTDPATGVVECTLDLGQVGGPGIYVAEFAVLASDLSTVAVSNQFTIIIERGLFAGDPTGIPTLAEIRMQLRDSPQNNELIGDFAWDNAEIIQALQVPVDYWNAALPDIQVYYTTQTWPPQFRHWWKQGTIATLYRIAAESQRRNQFDYAAGGIQIQDSNRSEAYTQAANDIWKEFTDWVRSRKIFMNQEQCWGVSNSGYSHAW